jgi:2',3'-cyclic-nucleotide 2'-phosphodiesterase (5'-nucleotidase family)
VTTSNALVRVLLVVACVLGVCARAAAAEHTITLYLTSDEHGWLNAKTDKARHVRAGGVVAMQQALDDDGFVPGPAGLARGVALFSQGDMWTGPYESTVLHGTPMVEAMNALGYAAAAIGNHDYDFGQDTLRDHARHATFPLLAANLTDDHGDIPDFAKPFVVIDVGGTKVGVVGLTNVDSPTTADVKNMGGLHFLPYASSLQTWVPRARAAGADVVIVLLHDGSDEARALVPVAHALGVSVIGAGHHHKQALALVPSTLVPSALDPKGANDDVTGLPDVLVCNPGAYLRAYCKLTLTVQDQHVRALAGALVPVERNLNDTHARNATLVQIVDDAERRSQEKGGEVLVDNVRTLPHGPGALGQFVVDSWLRAVPHAQVAITNIGGLRQDLEQGPVRVRDVVSVLPFDNSLVVLDLTGKVIREALANTQSVAAGVRFTYTQTAAQSAADTRTIVTLTDTAGVPLDDDKRYKTVINDFMLRGGDHYRFASSDVRADETAVDWREPVFTALRELAAAHRSLDVQRDDRATQLEAPPGGKP